MNSTFKFGVTQYLIGDGSLQCEICGQQILGKPNNVIIEGAKMIACNKCSKLGSTYWEPKTKTNFNIFGQKRPIEKKPLNRLEQMNALEDSSIEIIENYGLKVRKAREKLGFTHEELGKKIREKASVIKKIEGEKIDLEQKLAFKLERHLKIKLFGSTPKIDRKKFDSSILSSPNKNITLSEIVYFKDRKRGKKNENDNRSPQKS
jgi:putative transcription factor